MDYRCQKDPQVSPMKILSQSAGFTHCNCHSIGIQETLKLESTARKAVEINGNEGKRKTTPVILFPAD